VTSMDGLFHHSGKVAMHLIRDAGQTATYCGRALEKGSRIETAAAGVWYFKSGLCTLHATDRSKNMTCKQCKEEFLRV
jgi:hypothetical protein